MGRIIRSADRLSFKIIVNKMNDIKQELDRKGYIVLEHILTQDEVAEAKEEFYKRQDICRAPALP